MSSNVASRLSVTQVAKVAGPTRHGLRYYDSSGLLPEPPRSGPEYRRYRGKEVIELVHVASPRASGTPLPHDAHQLVAHVIDAHVMGAHVPNHLQATT